MIIGNRNRLAFELRPLNPTWKQRYVPERGAWASLSLFAGGVNLSQHIRQGSDRLFDAVNVPLLPIADWITRSWPALAFEERASVFATSRQPHEALRFWGESRPRAGLSEDEWIDAREEWWARHFLSAGADGSYLPSVGFVRQDDELVVSWAPVALAGEDPPTFLAGRGEASIPWVDGEVALREFVATVGAWAYEGGMQEAYSWVTPSFVFDGLSEDLRVSLPLFTGKSINELMELSRQRSFDGLIQWLGLDAGTRDPAAGPVPQALRDLPSALPTGLGELLRQLEEATVRPSGGTDGRWIESRNVATDAARAGESPEEAGQLAARALRVAWGLSGAPIGDTTQLLANQGVALPETTAEGQNERLLVGARAQGSAVAIVISTPRTRARWGARFEHVRALGHLFLDPLRGDAIGAASSETAQPTRRRRSGAFAAEFLLPIDALIDASDGALDAAAEPEIFGELLHDYGVGATTAANQLYNHQLLSSQSIRDELIEAYGHQEG